jgi:hypothetical protein
VTRSDVPRRIKRMVEIKPGVWLDCTPGVIVGVYDKTYARRGPDVVVVFASGSDLNIGALTRNAKGVIEALQGAYAELMRGG